MTLIRVNDETTRDELAEAITWAAQAAALIPDYCVEARAKAHERIDAMLDEMDSRTAN